MNALPRKGCSACDRPYVKARGLCQSCYDKWRRAVKAQGLGGLSEHRVGCDGCRHDVALAQTCAVCSRRLCPDCYGGWAELACAGCRLAAEFAKEERHAPDYPRASGDG